MSIPAKNERSQINSVMIHLNKLEKEKQTKSKASRGQISTDMNEIGNRKTIENINSNKSFGSLIYVE